MDPIRAIGRHPEPPNEEVYRAFAEACAAGRSCCLLTVTSADGSVPRGMGASMVVFAEGAHLGSIGGGNVEHRLIADAREAMRDGLPRRYRYDFTLGKDRNLDMACMGVIECLLQPFVAGPLLVIAGAGHVAQALAPMALALGYRVQVLDDRPDYPDAAAFPAGVTLVPGPFAESLAKLLAGGDEPRYLVVVTYGHARDETVLAASLGHPWQYAGLIGSKAKSRTILKALLEKHPDWADAISRLRAPIGLDLGGRSPADIALAILAEMQAVRHDKPTPAPLSRAAETVHAWRRSRE